MPKATDSNTPTDGSANTKAPAQASTPDIRKLLEQLRVPKMIVWIDNEAKIETTNLTVKTVDEILDIIDNYTISKATLQEALGENEEITRDVGGFPHLNDLEANGRNQLRGELRKKLLDGN